MVLEPFASSVPAICLSIHPNLTEPIIHGQVADAVNSTRADYTQFGKIAANFALTLRSAPQLANLVAELARQESTVDLQFRSGDVRRLVRGEKEHAVGDLIDLAGAP